MDSVTDGVLAIADVKPCASVHAGREKLKARIENQEEVFCICAIGRDFHIGCHDAKNQLDLAKEHVVLVPPERKNGPAIYRPVNMPEEQWMGLVADCQTQIDRAEAYIKTADERLSEAFTRLCEFGTLPESLGNITFNGTGMALIMEQCFSEDDLPRYLSRPESLAPTTDQLNEYFTSCTEFRARGRKQELETKLRLETALKPFEQAKLKQATDTIDRIENNDEVNQLFIDAGKVFDKIQAETDQLSS